ncbi:MAG: hypothetical protein ACOYMB_01330 [Patescibacteria group bacterium]
MFIKYSVNIEEYAHRHFIKKFSKKYGRAWDITIEALVREFQSFDIILEKSIAEIIVKDFDVKIIKTEFSVAGTKTSRHGSGNRCIVAMHDDQKLINVLLVYHKNDLEGSNETARWKQIIKENYQNYCHLL